MSWLLGLRHAHAEACCGIGSKTPRKARGEMDSRNSVHDRLQEAGEKMGKPIHLITQEMRARVLSVGVFGSSGKQLTLIDEMGTS
jgi:hypothetical protein